MNFNALRVLISNYGWLIAVTTVAGYLIVNQIKPSNNNGSNKKDISNQRKSENEEQQQQDKRKHKKSILKQGNQSSSMKKNDRYMEDSLLNSQVQKSSKKEELKSSIIKFNEIKKKMDQTPLRNSQQKNQMKEQEEQEHIQAEQGQFNSDIDCRQTIQIMSFHSRKSGQQQHDNDNNNNNNGSNVNNTIYNNMNTSSIYESITNQQYMNANSEMENEDANLSNYLKKQKMRLSRLGQSQSLDPDYIFNKFHEIYNSKFMSNDQQ